MKQSPRNVTDQHRVELWRSFLDSYTSSATRPMVDVFLRALIGGPSRHDD